jgi:hypothetical protein
MARRLGALRCWVWARHKTSSNTACSLPALHWAGCPRQVQGITLTDDDSKDLAKFRKAFEQYCTPMANEVIERYQFWQLVPGPAKPV